MVDDAEDGVCVGRRGGGSFGIGVVVHGCSGGTGLGWCAGLKKQFKTMVRVERRRLAIVSGKSREVA